MIKQASPQSNVPAPPGLVSDFLRYHSALIYFHVNIVCRNSATVGKHIPALEGNYLIRDRLGPDHRPHRQAGWLETPISVAHSVIWRSYIHEDLRVVVDEARVPGSCDMELLQIVWYI